MSKINDGGPAFAAPSVFGDKEAVCHERGELGMSLRDHLGAEAMHALLAGGAIGIIDHALEAKLGPSMNADRNAMIKKFVCKDAWEWADAMLAAREGGPV